jgi:hypothetical protein
MTNSRGRNLRPSKLSAGIGAALSAPAPATNDKLAQQISDAMMAKALDHKHLWRYEVDGKALGIAITPDDEKGENMLRDGQTIVLETSKTLVMNPRTLERIRKAAPADELVCLHAQGWEDQPGGGKRCPTCGVETPF